MQVVENTLSERSLVTLRLLKGKRLETVFTEHERLDWFTQGTVIMRTPDMDVAFTLHEDAFSHPLVSDVSTMTIETCTPAVTQQRLWVSTLASGEKVEKYRLSYRVGNIVRKILVMIDQSELFPNEETPLVLLHDVCAIAFVFDTETIILDKGTFWTDSWQVFRHYGTLPHFHKTKQSTIIEL